MSVALLTGDRQSGKTSVCRRLAEAAGARGLSVAGIVAPAIVREGRCVGYEVVDLATGRSAVLATIEGPGVEQVGPFHFTAEGLAVGRAALEHAAALPDALVIVDEVGPLELSGGGWAKQLPSVASRLGVTLLTVRRELASEVAEIWHVRADSTFDLANGSDATLSAILACAGGVEP
jgi:nucleoside-triphosphatase THEP1